MLTEQQKIDVRRHSGFPVYGQFSSTSPSTFGYRYYTQYLILEYRMNNLAPEEETTLINVYLVNCNNLEAAIPTASSNLDTDRAAVWYHNKYEVRDRMSLYTLWCNRLIEFMGLESPSPLKGSLRVMV